MRARNIKPGFFQNETLPFLDPYCRLLFIGLWMLADREGRLEDRPLRIKAQVFPYEQIGADALLDDLQVHGFLQRYEVEGCKYIQILNFEKHQSPHVKEKASTIPAPDLSGTNTVPAPPDSLNPDSLNPDKTLCVKPEGLPRANGQDFERFWSQWPVKRNKAKAKQAFQRKKFTAKDVDELIADIQDRMKRDNQWKRGYIPHCSTYLNGNRWEDEYGN